jgi:hypothetical protein
MKLKGICAAVLIFLGAGSSMGAVDSEEAQAFIRQCDKKTVQDPSVMYRALQIRTSNLNLPDDDSLQGYIESRVADGSLTEKQKELFWNVIAIHRRGIRNPSSRGAGSMSQAIAQTLICFGIDKPAKASTRPRQVSTDPFSLAKRFAELEHVRLYVYKLSEIGKGADSFAPIIASRQGDILIIGTRSGRAVGAPYETGKSLPVVIKLDATGKRLWEKSLRKKGFLDFEGATIAQAPDNGYIAFIKSYVNPVRGASTRLVKLSPSGETLWDYHFRGDGKGDTPFADRLHFSPTGSILISGHVSIEPEKTTPWTAELDRDGKVISDQVLEKTP